MRHQRLTDADCAIAQAVAVVGDWWTLLVLRDVAGGVHRFDALQTELGVSRKVLAERLTALVGSDVLETRAYSDHPPRHEYHLTPKGRALLPVLIDLQTWGSRWVMGDGTQTATSEPTSPEAHRVRGLVGKPLGPIRLRSAGGELVDPVADSDWTLIYCYPGAFAPVDGAYPPGWTDIPGTRGCTLESVTFRDRIAEFEQRGVTVRGVSTQRPDEMAAFGSHASIPFELLSDNGLDLTAALRLPTFRASGVDRLKRLSILVRSDRTIVGTLYPVPDPAASVEDALRLVDDQLALRRRATSVPGH